jgi:hypothetical protein
MIQDEFVQRANHAGKPIMFKFQNVNCKFQSSLEEQDWVVTVMLAMKTIPNNSSNEFACRKSN